MLPKDPELNPQNPHKRLGVVTCIFNPSAGEVERQVDS